MNTAPEKPIFQIGAEGVDVEALMEEIRQTVARKMESGVYRDIHVARAEKANLINIRNEESFLDFYLECLRHAAQVDINDFPIQERRRCGGRLWVASGRP